MKVLCVSGSSGGHIFPALGFLDKLKEVRPDAQTLLVLPERNINQKAKIGHPVKYISVSSISPGFSFKSAISIFRFLKGFFQSFFIVLEFRPDVAIGFGSISSIPVILFSWIFRVRTVIHEQNVLLGRANRFLAVFADKIAVSFKETLSLLKVSKDRIVFTGNPLRREISRVEKKAALDFFGFQPDRFTIMVMGGSQASHRINLSFIKAVFQLSTCANLQIIHLCGIKDYPFLGQAYKTIKAQIKLYEFLQPVHYGYSASDLVVSRAGATAVTELLFFKVPAIIVPYPLAHKHQYANAQVLKELGSAIIINDDALESGILKDTIENLLSDKIKLGRMRASYDKACFKEGAQALVPLVIEG